MNLLEVTTILERIGKDRRSEDFQLVIPVEKVRSIGSTPAVNVKYISLGFDWDSGRIILWPEEKLRVITENEIKSLRENYEELEWKHYEISNLKRENKRLMKELQEMKEK